jgi:hypothetical protein
MSAPCGGAIAPQADDDLIDAHAPLCTHGEPTVLRVLSGRSVS